MFLQEPLVEPGAQIEGQMASPANPTRCLLVVGGKRGVCVCVCVVSDGELGQLIKH